MKYVQISAEPGQPGDTFGQPGLIKPDIIRVPLFREPGTFPAKKLFQSLQFALEWRQDTYVITSISYMLCDSREKIHSIFHNKKQS